MMRPSWRRRRELLREEPVTESWSTDEVVATKMQYRSMRFDSKLELMWFLTLERYGFDIWDHPASLMLEDGTEYQPDFLVGDVLCEVKGEHNERLWKPYAAQQQFQLPVLVLRAGVVPSDTFEERAGCDWESCDGDTWVMCFGDDGSEFLPLHDAEMIYPPERVRFAARDVQLAEDRVGVALIHWSEGRE